MRKVSRSSGKKEVSEKGLKRINHLSIATAKKSHAIANNPKSWANI